MCPPPTPIKGASSNPTPPPAPLQPPSSPLLFFLAQGMNCKSIQVFQQRCRVEEILLRFSRFCFAAFFSAPPPPFTPPFTLQPPLHLKNPMKPVECCRAFQHLWFFHSPQRPAAQPGPRLRLSGAFFCSPFKGPVFLYLLLLVFTPYLLIPTAQPLTQGISQTRGG